MKIVDTRGLMCPAPLIKTRQALKEAAADETVRVIIDNKTSLGNVKRYLADNKVAFTVSEDGDISYVTVTPGGATEMNLNESEYCSSDVNPSPRRRNTVVAITSDKMGTGDDELGSKLINSFFRTLVMVEPAPASLVFYNTGVKLARDDSPVYEYINELQAKGTAIYICTTCINHFNIKDRLPSGNFSDMYQILNILKDADHIISP